MSIEVSVMIPTFNCAAMLAQTLRSVVAQGLPSDRMEIAVVDDCSTADDPELVTQEFGDQVRFVRQSKNVGATRNFNDCIRLAQGELIHILHGDDFALPGFYSAILDAAARFPEIGLFCTRSVLVDEAGVSRSHSSQLQFMVNGTRDVGPLIYGGNPILTPSVVVRRSAYFQLGPFDESLVHMADWEMWVRVIAAYGGVFIDQSLAAYRVFEEQDTARLKLTGENLRDAFRLNDVWVRVLAGFDQIRFLHLIEATAVNQSAEFESRGMPAAASANRLVLDEARNRLRAL